MYLAPQGAPNVDMQSIYVKKCHFFNKKVKNPLEKCVSGATRGVLHYVFKRKWSILTKKWQFLVGNMCNPARRTPGTAELEASVAEMLASEARQPFSRGGALPAYKDPTLCLFPGDRSRESGGTWQLPQTSLLGFLCFLCGTRKARIHPHSKH